ncbi:MAG: bifunctional 5,10-methylenetetrahydrofolate dehydrogenase/5,10-methenyltetrahydrofolate cyclohydrolase [Planctomycetes bacterium]|nr:bifunctional 5,10-methylenetetrahydrofolate dehydrogenase/5,10-methenyltetrahydrofolate cyclohydrolase [Planctomycetota bacterium]
MPARILDGKSLAASWRERLHDARESLGDRPVNLVSLEVGENPAAKVYIRNQKRAAKACGIELVERLLPATTTEAELLEIIQGYNADPGVTGIIMQRPLPLAIDARRVQATISRTKDVEGMNPSNMGAILYCEPKLTPCTALAAVTLIQHSGIDMKGAETVVVGHSEIVGKPVAILLLHHLSTVTVCHIGTRNLREHTKRADILVVAVGKPHLVTGDMIKPGAVVIDIGINANPNGGGIVGDVHFDSAKEVAGFITPVPGGVGPLTVAMLMRNTLRAAGWEG